MMNPDMLYVIKPEEQNRASLTEILTAHPEIKFVSFMGVDFAGNDTDEKVPISLFLKDIDGIMEGMAAQTDGSSVVLTGIATLNNARVDMKIDSSVNWYIDYNYEHFDTATGKMIGTLRIPCFLVHNNIRVDSRSILHDTLDYVEKELTELFKKHPQVAGLEHINGEDIEKLIFTCATELEFWVKSPREDAPIEALSSSGHKECGGVRGQIDDSGHMTHVMEQLEVDWKYSYGVQTADNELLARIIVKEIFRLNGLEVSFQAKPVPGVAGSGEHTHVGIAAKMKNGKIVNLFAPQDMHKEFLSAVGYGSMMGLLKNYEVINPIISSTIDSLNRLKPGFEAPVCIVTSLGLSPGVPSRNRTILAGLIRDIDNPLATRIEMRSPNPYTNTYLAIAAFYIAMLDGIKACVESGKTLKEMENELSKKAGEEGFYLEKDREYRSEHDVFEDYNEEERAHLFGKPPATVWENMCAIKNYPEKIAVLTAGNIFKKEFIDSFAAGALIRWQTELLNRIIPEYHKEICLMKKLHDDDNHTTHDAAMWEKIAAMRNTMAKDFTDQPSLFTMTRQAFARGDFDAASSLQLEMAELMQKLKAQYNEYQHNIID